MKLLLDQNLSPRLVTKLTKDYPDISHVQLLGLERATDVQLWNFAKEEDFIILTKDNDFIDFSELFNSPPKVIRLNVGNCSSSYIEQLLIRSKLDISRFVKDENLHYLILQRSVA